MKAVKSNKQKSEPNQDLQLLMETFRQLVNHCIKVGPENNRTANKEIVTIPLSQIRELADSQLLQTKCHLAGSWSGNLASRCVKGRKLEIKTPTLEQNRYANIESI